jgi:hypothetical protein
VLKAGLCSPLLKGGLGPVVYCLMVLLTFIAICNTFLLVLLTFGSPRASHVLFLTMLATLYSRKFSVAVMRKLHKI